MKKIILVLAFSAFGYLSLQAQGVSRNGCLWVKTSTADFKSISQETGSDTWNAKSIEERMKGMFEKPLFWILISQLQFTREEKLEGPGQGGGMRWMSSMTGGGGNYIKM
jgi:hypothetical protein